MEKKNNKDSQYLGSLLEQYKLYVTLSDNVSNRRNQNNQFYISLSSGILAAAALLSGKESLHQKVDFINLIVAFVGVLISFIWHINIKSYRQLNSGKFKVIHEMEKELPFQCFEKEWLFLKAGKEKKDYFPLSRIEQWIPLIMIIPHLALLILSAYSLLK